MSTSRKRARPKPPPGCFWVGETLYGRYREHSKNGKPGKLVRWSLETDDPRVAAKRRQERKEEYDKPRDARLTVADAWAAWTQWLPTTGKVNAGTIKTYQNALAQLDPWLDGKYLDQIDNDLIREMIETRGQQVTVATVKRNLGALSSLCRYAVYREWLPANPVLKHLEQMEERRDPIILPRQSDVEKVVAHINNSPRSSSLFALMVVAACVTGCREEELAGATHANLDLKGQRLLIIGKRRKLRVIDLVPFGGAEVFARLPAGIANAPLFFHGQGKRFQNVASRFSHFTAVVAKNDPDFIRFKFHHLRHLHAVQWLRSGRSIYELQKRLGHASIKTTEIYLDYLDPKEQLVCQGLLTAGISTGIQNDGISN